MAYNVQTGGYLYDSTGTKTFHCSSLPLNMGQTVVKFPSDGDLVPSLSGITQIRPTYTFTSYDVDTILGYVGTTALGTTTLSAFYQVTTNGGTRESNHNKHAIAKALIVVDSITVSQGAAATVSGTVYVTSTDGTTKPITVTSAALPAFSAISAGAGTLGPVTINGAALDGVQSWTLNFNHQVTVEQSDGDLYPTIATLISSDPVMTITSSNVDQITTIALEGKNISSTTSATILGFTNGIVGSTILTVAGTTGSITMLPISANHGSRNTVDLQIDFTGNRSGAVTIS